MLPKSALLQDDRAFIGRQAIRRELTEGTSRWSAVGIVVDWADWDRLHRDAGLLPREVRASPAVRVGAL